MDEAGRNKLWTEYHKTKSADIREQLILEYAPLVKLVAGRLSMYLGFNVEYDDLVGYGIFGLIDAIDKFDLMKDVKFETYASLRIRGAILDQIRKMDWIPRTIRQRQKKIDAAIKEIERDGGHVATDAEIAADGDYLDLLSKDYSTDMPHDKTDFMNNEENKASVMLSSTMEINEVMDTLTNYKKEFVYPKNDKIHCRFIYEWSIGDGTEAEKRAGELLLSWMLGTPYQTMLMISRASDGQIPVNKAAFYEKCGQSNLAPIKDIYGSFVFER